MEISKAAVGFVLAAGLAVGAGGAYFAGRSFAPAEPPMAIADGTDGTLAPDAEPVETASPTVTGAMSSPVAPRVARPAPVRAVRGAEPAASARTDAVSSPADVEERPAPAAPPEPIASVEAPPIPAAEPAGPELIELVVSADSVIGLQLDSTITTERARIEDPVEAHVVRDVRVGDRVAIPAGSKVSGQVTLVERGGRVKERARLGVRFTSVSLPDGERRAIHTEPIFREGESQAASSSTRIGVGAGVGAVLGGILGGAKGAAIGGSVGAGAGTAAVMAGSRNQATLQSGSPITVRIEQPIVLTVER